MNKSKQKKNQSILYTIVIICSLILFFCLSIRNNLISLEEVIDHEWGYVENLTGNRYTLLQTLITHLEDTGSVTPAFLSSQSESYRRYRNAKTVTERVKESAQLEQLIERLRITLKHNSKKYIDNTTRRLMNELSFSQKSLFIQQERFNKHVDFYNTTLDSRPSVWFASLFNFEKKQGFDKVKSTKNE